MTSRNSSFNLTDLRGRFKRGLWMPGLIAAALFFMLPVVAALTISNLQTEAELLKAGNDAAYVLRYFTNRMTDLIEQTGIAVMLLAIPAAILTGLIAFNYLNNRRQVDFYHSLPRTRQSLFTTSWLYGALSFLLPYALMLGIMLAIVGLSGHFAVFDMALMGRFFSRTVLLFLACYALSVLAAMLCGHILVSLCGALTFLIYPPVLIGLSQLLCSRYFETYYESADFIETLFRLTSPVADFMYDAGNSFDNAHPLWWIALTALFTGLALFACLRRPSEAAGKALAFRVTRPFIKYPLVMIASLLFGLFFEAAGNSTAWMVFGYAAGIVFAHIFLQVIFDFDLRAAGRGWKGLGVFTCVFALGISALWFDWIGFDSRLPDPDKLTRVGFQFNELSSTYYESGPIRIDGNGDYISYYSADMREQLTFEEEELKQLGMEIAESAVTALRNQEEDPLNLRGSYNGGDVIVLTFEEGGSR